MTLSRALAVVLGLSVVSMFASAQEDSYGVSIANTAIDVKSKRRAYPGGRDEEDLKVQASLPQPSRDPDVRTSSAPQPVDEPAHD
jgi:hypothetical protein